MHRRDRRGAASFEFVLVLTAILTLLIGILEVAWQSTIAAALDRATLRASRFGSTGQPVAPGAPPEVTCRSTSIAWIITSSTGGMLRADRLVVSLGAHGSPATMGAQPVVGAGLGGQVVTYAVTYTQPFLSSVWLGLIGGPDRLIHRASVVVKNEAFDNAVC
ncbi:TadE/TadG family type IV pilus assembly protein [Falsiroseomonas oryzae]|uniref:TadE/TadG family type IV pilus assembly protein n=1 Tax=Falsiroseomonas oryzae TaxID=2766473 RepID=UPI0022EA6E42|nr:hypothetical protein [Roseomonas sp. MO-31]